MAPCSKFRPHPWRKGVCTECFNQKSQHKLCAEQSDSIEAADSLIPSKIPVTNSSPELKSSSLKSRPPIGRKLSSAKQRKSLESDISSCKKPVSPLARSVTPSPKPVTKKCKSEDGNSRFQLQQTSIDTENGYSTNDIATSVSRVTSTPDKECWERQNLPGSVPSSAVLNDRCCSSGSMMAQASSGISSSKKPISPLARPITPSPKPATKECKSEDGNSRFQRQRASVDTESGYSTNDNATSVSGVTSVPDKECWERQTLPASAPSSVFHNDRYCSSGSMMGRTFSFEDILNPDSITRSSSEGSLEPVSTSGQPLRVSVSAESVNTPIMSTQEQEDFLQDLSSAPSEAPQGQKSSTPNSGRMRGSVPAIVFSDLQKQQSLERKRASLTEANRRAFSETDLWENANTIQPHSDLDGHSVGGSSTSGGKSSLKRLIKKVIKRTSKDQGKPGLLNKRSSGSSQNSRESDSTASDVSSAISAALTPAREHNFENLFDLQEVPKADDAIIARRHYARGASSWDQACIPPRRLKKSKGGSMPVHHACVYPLRQRHTQQTLQALSDKTVVVTTGNTCCECASPTCEATELSSTDCAEMVWGDYFDSVEVNSIVDDELNSIQSGLRAVWDKALELVTKPLPDHIAKVATDWNNLELIGHDTGQYPSTNYAHLECVREGKRNAFSMEIDMGVPMKHARISPLLRDCLIREAMSEHFNILQPRARLSQRLPIDVECQMDMATSDSVPRQCYVTDFLGNYVSGYTFVSLCLMGKNLCEYEERVILLVLQLLLALEHAYSHGIVHRCVELDKILVGTVEGLSGDRLLLNGFEYALSAANDKRVKVEASSHPPADWYVYNVNELLYLGCNIAHLPPEIIGLCDSSPQLDFSRVDTYAAGVFISELLEVFGDNHNSVLHYISKAMMAPAPSIRLTLTKARRILECWLWGPRSWLQKAGSSDDVPFSRVDIKTWLVNRQTALLSTVALRGMLGQVTVSDVLHCRFLSSARSTQVQSAGQWLHQLACSGKI